MIGVELVHKFELKKEPIPFVITCNYCHKLAAVRKAWVCISCGYVCHLDCKSSVSSVAECGAKVSTISFSMLTDYIGCNTIRQCK